MFHDCIHIYELEAVVSDSSSSGDSDETQWDDENLKDPWAPERIAKETTLLDTNPDHRAQCYWAARKAMRRYLLSKGTIWPSTTLPTKTIEEENEEAAI